PCIFPLELLTPKKSSTSNSLLKRPFKNGSCSEQQYQLFELSWNTQTIKRTCRVLRGGQPNCQFSGRSISHCDFKRLKSQAKEGLIINILFRSNDPRARLRRKLKTAVPIFAVNDCLITKG